jgi:hypothetical protein
MPSFAKRIHIDEFGEFEFVFTHVYTRYKEQFKVIVYDGKAKVCNFTMQPVLHYWMIADGIELPIWVAGIEQELEKVIRQHSFATA